MRPQAPQAVTSLPKEPTTRVAKLHEPTASPCKPQWATTRQPRVYPNLPKNREAPASHCEPPQGRPDPRRQPRVTASYCKSTRASARTPTSRRKSPRVAASRHKTTSEPTRTSARRPQDTSQSPRGTTQSPRAPHEPPRATRKADPRRRNEPRPGPQTRRGRTNQVGPQARRSHRTRPQARRVDPRHGRRNPTPLGWTSPAEGAKIGFAVTSMSSTV